MKAHNITIDINQLDTDQLNQLSAMLYQTQFGSATAKEISERIAFLSGWMSEKREAEHIAAYC